MQQINAVAKLKNEDLKLLISNASSIQGPGFFAPARNHELIKWLLENGFHVGWPVNIMTIGSYLESSTFSIHSILIYIFMSITKYIIMKVEDGIYRLKKRKVVHTFL